MTFPLHTGFPRIGQVMIAPGETRSKACCRTLRGMTRELTLRIVVVQPPAGVDFALQKGSGNNYESLQRQRSDGGDLVFEFQPLVKEGADGAAVLRGPFVQGPAQQRFVYLDIGTCAGQADSCWSRMLKVP